MSYIPRRYNRLTDNDRHLGPFTLGERSQHYRSSGIDIRSGDDEHPGASINIKITGWWLRIAIPSIVKPWREFHAVKGDEYWDAHGGGYWNAFPCEYGFTFSNGALHLCYGPQTHDGITTKSKCYFLPWRQWRHVRRSFYDLTGAHWWTEPKPCLWDVMNAKRDECPTVRFLIEDYDGEQIVATTRIEEMEWRFGDGSFRWLSLFRRPKVRRSLSIEFDKEVGTEKGSWKGGLMGTSIDMLPGELHEAAFRRFCEQDVRNKYGPSRIKFIGSVPDGVSVARPEGSEPSPTDGRNEA